MARIAHAGVSACDPPIPCKHTLAAGARICSFVSRHMDMACIRLLPFTVCSQPDQTALVEANASPADALLVVLVVFLP